MSPADWLLARLTGAWRTSVSMASGTGLLAGRSGRWDAAALRLAGVSARALPPISDEPIVPGQTTCEAIPSRPFFAELADARWFPALGDGAAGNLGSDAIGAGIAAINVGTSGATRLIVPRWPNRLPRALFCLRCDGTRALVGGAISNAGNLRAWALSQLRLSNDPRRIEQALAARSLPEHGLTVLPFWTGERAPSWPEAVSGTVAGLTYATDALDLLQASIEATYHRLAQIVDALEPFAGGPLELVISGGIRRSSPSLQRLADVLGRPLRACAEGEASLRGAAVAVAERLGFRVAKLRSGRRFVPRPGPARAYAKARRAQAALEAQMETQTYFATRF